jgi:hypothetical protein
MYSAGHGLFAPFNPSAKAKKCAEVTAIISARIEN